ncbi:MAG: GNAT family N-acetyltransferase [Candidatus Humimicrobiaceae bacterium]
MEQAEYIDYKAIKKIKQSEGQILIRPLTKDDLEQTIIWLKDPQINKFLAATFEDLDLKKELDWLSEMNGSLIDFIFAVEDKKSKRYIGNCGLHKVSWENKTCEFGILIGEKEYWGKAFGTDTINCILKIAFNKLNMRNIKLFVYEYNERAINAYKKCGFTVKEILKDDHLYADRYWDTIVMEKSAKIVQD